MRLAVKICGMREPDNIIAVAELRPDLLGFIFYPGSPRFAAKMLSPEILARSLPDIRKTGVFVNADPEEIKSTAGKYSLDIVQLHGNENPEVCRRLKDSGMTVIKAFNISDSTHFNICYEFLNCTDYFLFDTATPAYGGSGSKFSWEVLDRYDLGHPFFLSGGISPLDTDSIMEITNASFYGIDLNSRFEIKPGLKDIEKLKKFLSGLRKNNNQL